MAKPLTVSDTAYAVLAAQKQPHESFSDVILRLAPPPIETCGDLLDYLESTDRPLIDSAFLKELRERKKNPKRSPRKGLAH
jgi:predicted CopG family antitoxin